MKLKDLLDGWVTVVNDMEITGLSLDSRKVDVGDVFIALSGFSQHGLTHFHEAKEKGASAYIYDPEGGGRELAATIKDKNVIEIKNIGSLLGAIGARFYGDPSRNMDVIGITGTNGKTTCSHFLAQLLTDCAVIGTLGWGEYGKLNKTANTTPDALEVQWILSELKKTGHNNIAMEVSSHGLNQGRVNGVHFRGALYTNISRDHLDYHHSMEAYLDAKLELLKSPMLEFVVVNSDDAYCETIISEVPEAVDVWTFSCRGKIKNPEKSIVADKILIKSNGTECEITWFRQTRKVSIPLYGEFNVENVLATVAVIMALGFSFREATAKLENLKPVTGRMEYFGGGLKPKVFVDFAHTPDALEKVIVSLRKQCTLGTSTNSLIWIVFGCGGDRDKGKRAQMGAIATKWADRVVITDDNPRYEESINIINDILTGCEPGLKGNSLKLEVIQDRKQAIESVISKAGKNDLVLIAGKGHENYQENKGVRMEFSDQQIVIEALNKNR